MPTRWMSILEDSQANCPISLITPTLGDKSSWLSRSVNSRRVTRPFNNQLPEDNDYSCG